MTRYLFLLCITLGFFQVAHAASWIHKAEDITEEWLVTAGAETGYTEHVRHIKKVFEVMKIRGFIEYGLGFSTKYFLDHCDHVTSIEFVTPGTGPEWMKYCIDLFKNIPTWKPVAYFAGKGLDTSWAKYKYLGTENVYKAVAYQPVHRKSYAAIDPTYLDDMKKNLQQELVSGDFDMAFVDAGICNRGDMVQILFNNVPIIAAHDIAAKAYRHLDDVYGYGRIIVPENYEEIYIPFGMGTAFWVKKDAKYQKVIQALKNYVQNPS